MTHETDAIVSRIMSIRNGMMVDTDAEALIRREIGALCSFHFAPTTADEQPVAWRYKDFPEQPWIHSSDEPHDRWRFREPLFSASPDTSTIQKCDGCDGHECDNGCAYPGAVSPPDRADK